MLVGYDYNSEEEGDYLPDDSIVIEKPSTIASTTAMSSTAPTVKKQSLIGLAATTSKLSKLDSAVEVENAANRKRVKLFSTSSKLHEILPAPKNEAKVTPDMLAAEVKAKKVQQEMEEENLNESSSEDSNVREEKQSNVSVNNNSSNIAQYEESSDIDSDEEERRLEALIQLQKQQAQQEKKQQPPPEVPHLTAVAKPVQPPNPSAPIQYVMPAKQAQVQNSILAQIQAQKQQQAQLQAQQNQLHPSFAMQKQLPPEQLQQLQNQQRLQWQQQQQQMQAPQLPQNFQPPSIQSPLLLQQVQQQQQQLPQFPAPQPVYEQPSLLHQQPAAVADDVPDADAAILGPMRPAEESWGEYDYAPMPGAEPQEYDSAAYYAEQDRLMNQEIQSKRWGEMNKIDSSQVIQIRATDIHNGQYTRTELAHKERLEKMSVNMHKQISSRRGQLSVIAMEAERQSLQDEERRAAQKQMRRETRQRYGW